MALVKGIENQFGAQFNYHKISEVRVIAEKGDIQLRITTESYVDRKSRFEGKKGIKTVNIIQHADFALAPFYALLKAKFGDFGDATDDFETFERTIQNSVITQQTPAGDLISQYTEGENL